MKSSTIKGITIAIGGDTSALEKSLKNVDSSAKSLQRELKGVDSLLKLDPSNTTLLAQKQELLGSAVDETKQKLKQLQATQKKLSDSGMDKTSSTYRDLEREIEKTKTDLTQLEKQQKSFNQTSIKMKSAIANMEKYGNKAKEAASKLSGVSTAATIAASAAVAVGADFDAGMSEVAAISGATGDTLTALRDKAIEMGSSTKFSSTEAAEAMKYMAMAGWDAEQMMDGIGGVLDLAAASGEDLATTSDIVTDGLTAFGYSAEDAGRFANIMAAASSNANTNVEMMGETMKYAGSVAGSLGYSMEDVSLATGLMANSGIKASQAGTSLRSMMSRMAAPTASVQKAMEQVGVSLTDSEGNMKSFREVMVELRNGMSGMTETEKTQVASTIAGKNAMSGFLAIVNSSDKDFNKLADAIDNSSGSASEMAATMNNNLSGQVTIIKSSLEALAITVSDILTPALSKVATWVQNLVNKFNDASPTTQKLITAFGVLAAAAAPLLSGFALMVSIGSKVVTGFGAIRTAMATLTGTMAATTTAETLNTAATTAQGNASVFAAAKQRILNLVMRANPIGLVITAITALIAAFALFGGKTDELAKKINGFFNKLLKKAQNFANNAPKMMEKFIKYLIANLPQIVKTGAKIVSALAKGIWACRSVLKEYAIKLLIHARDAIKNKANEWMSIGKNLVEGLWNGITSKFSWIVGKIESFTDSIKSKLKSFFGINSPSKWSRDMIGKNLALGMGIGFEKNLSTVESSMQKSLNGMKVMGATVKTDIASDVSNGVSTAMMASAVGSTAKGTQNLYVTVELGGTKVGEQIVKLYDRTKLALG